MKTAAVSSVFAATVYKPKTAKPVAEEIRHAQTGYERAREVSKPADGARAGAAAPTGSGGTTLNIKA